MHQIMASSISFHAHLSTKIKQILGYLDFNEMLESAAFELALALALRSDTRPIELGEVDRVPSDTLKQEKYMQVLSQIQKT